MAHQLHPAPSPSATGRILVALAAGFMLASCGTDTGENHPEANADSAPEAGALANADNVAGGHAADDQTPDGQDNNAGKSGAEGWRAIGESSDDETAPNTEKADRPEAAPDPTRGHDDRGDGANNGSQGGSSKDRKDGGKAGDDSKSDRSSDGGDDGKAGGGSNSGKDGKAGVS